MSFFIRGSNKSSKNIVGGDDTNADIENDLKKNFEDIFGTFFTNLRKNHVSSNGKVYEQVEFFKWKNMTKEIKREHEEEDYDPEDISYITLNKTLRIIAAASYLDRMRVNPAQLMTVKNFNEFDQEVSKVTREFEGKILAAYNDKAASGDKASTVDEAIKKLYLNAVNGNTPGEITVVGYDINNRGEIYKVDPFNLRFTKGTSGLTYSGVFKIETAKKASGGTAPLSAYDNSGKDAKKIVNAHGNYKKLHELNFIPNYNGTASPPTSTATPPAVFDELKKSVDFNVLAVLNNIHESIAQGYFQMVYGDASGLNFNKSSTAPTDPVKYNYNDNKLIEDIKPKLIERYKDINFRQAFEDYFMFIDKNGEVCTYETFISAKAGDNCRINLKKQGGSGKSYAQQYSAGKVYANLSGGAKSPYGSPIIVDLLPELPPTYDGTIWFDRTLSQDYSSSNKILIDYVTKNYRGKDARNILRAVGIEALFDTKESTSFDIPSGKLNYGEIINISTFPINVDFTGYLTSINLETLLKQAQNAASGYSAHNKIVPLESGWVRDKNTGLYYIADPQNPDDKTKYAYDNNDANNCPRIDGTNECINFIKECFLADSSKFPVKCNNFFNHVEGLENNKINLDEMAREVTKMNPEVAKSLLKKFKVGMVVDKENKIPLYRVQSIDSWLKKLDSHKEYFGAGNVEDGIATINNIKRSYNFLSYLEMIINYVNSNKHFLNPELNTSTYYDGAWENFVDEKTYKVRKYVDPYSRRGGHIGDLTSALNNMKVTMDNAYANFQNGVNVNSLSIGVNPAPINLAVNPAIVGPFAASMLRGGYDIYSDRFVSGGSKDDINPISPSNGEIFRKFFERVEEHARTRGVEIDEATKISFASKVKKYNDLNYELNKVVDTLTKIMEIKNRSGGQVDIMVAIPDDITSDKSMNEARTLIDKYKFYLNKQITLSNKISQRGIQIVTTINNLASAINQQIAKDNGEEDNYLPIR